MAESLEQKLTLLINLNLKAALETDLDSLLALLAKETGRILDADRCTVFLADRQTGELWSKVAQGLELKTIRLLKGQGFAGEAMRLRRTINIKDAYADTRFSRNTDSETGYKTRSLLAMPMWDFQRKNVLGIFEVLNKKAGPFTRQDERLLTILSDNAAVAVENTQLYQDLKRAQQETVFRLALMAEHRDQKDTAAHLRRVSVYTGLLAQALGLPSEETETLRLASTLHDIGKVATPDVILLKSNKFNALEMGEVEYRLAWWVEKLKLMDAPLSRRKQIARFLEDIRRANRPSSTAMPEELVVRIQKISSERFIDTDGEEKPLLSQAEVEKLTIRRGNLTREEIEEIRRHTIYGARILAQADSQLMRVAERIALTHHEKYDGSGYPKGMKGEKIPLEGRLVGLVDVVDALSSKRVYKAQWSFKEVESYLRKESGKHFDPKLVKVFLKASPLIQKAMKTMSPKHGKPSHEDPC